MHFFGRFFYKKINKVCTLLGGVTVVPLSSIRQGAASFFFRPFVVY
ncbi:hypothetical protein SUBVAR_07427 [Subdoligranulum variabile DSM 15176]|uniref:Uncharacterized protein n=1 Tax=Subdoligranulum variabile DSM 15176 TaxID=411471 RepID=D1PSP3_9FIRM|nr:hypothetical protein SUBVAR_07427 [Subdoligranulum variabile DSM 15176]